MKLIFPRTAAFEIAEAFAHCEIQRPGLGLEFASSVDAACAEIIRNPLAFPPAYRTARKLHLRRFGHTLYVLVLAEQIDVVAVFQSNRDPHKLRSRLEDESA